VAIVQVDKPRTSGWCRRPDPADDTEMREDPHRPVLAPMDEPVVRNGGHSAGPGVDVPLRTGFAAR
jgi:hypothetical protein